MSDGRKPSAGGISGDADLAAALAGLERVSRDRFAEDGALYFFGAMPRALLLRAAAYKMQERGLGGLLAPTRRRLSGRNRARSSASAGSETAHPLIHSLNLPIAGRRKSAFSASPDSSPPASNRTAQWGNREPCWANVRAGLVLKLACTLEGSRL